MAARHQGERPGADDALTVPPLAAAPGLLLRSWTDHDIPAMADARRDPVLRHWLRHPVTTAEEAHRIIRARPLEQLELIHSVGHQASCRVAGQAGFALSAVLPPLLPEFPANGHLYIRPAGY